MSEEVLSNLRFADNVILLAQTFELKEIINELAIPRKRLSLEMNLNKTKILLTDASEGNIEIGINGEKIAKRKI